MEDTKKMDYEASARNIIEVLLEEGYHAVYAADKTAARKIVLDTIQKGSSISLGGSITIEELDLLETFRSTDYRLYDRYDPKLTSEQDHELRRQSMIADYLVTSTNAITKKGELVNIDCSGNKTAGMIFGPKHVVIVAGVNKIVENLDEAMKRLYYIAPRNSKRSHHYENPCVATGKCCEEQCNTRKRMCNYISIINNGRKYEGRYTIVVIPEEIGY
jgi:L-lactate utilization protein LutB